MGVRQKNPIPPTKEQVTGIPKMRHEGKAIVCQKCRNAGGTLVKVGDNEYVHQNQALCKILGKIK